jgi:hypothetical protein
LTKSSIVVILGFMPGIHVFVTISSEDVDGRDKPGHDVKQRLMDCLSCPGRGAAP